MAKPVRVCTSIDCPERRSICCGAKPEAVSGNEGTGYYRCQACHKEYIGGECNASIPPSWFDLAFDSLPEWIEENYPKGNKERGKIVVILTNYLLWLKNHD